MTLNLVPTEKSCPMEYKDPNCYQSKDMANVNVSANKQTDKRTGQNLYAPDKKEA